MKEYIAMTNEFNLTPKQIEYLKKRSADLQVQSMLFDADIDWELLTLMEKSDYKEPGWVARWKTKQADADYMSDGSDDQEYDNE